MSFLLVFPEFFSYMVFSLVSPMGGSGPCQCVVCTCVGSPAQLVLSMSCSVVVNVSSRITVSGCTADPKHIEVSNNVYSLQL